MNPQRCARRCLRNIFPAARASLTANSAGFKKWRDGRDSNPSATWVSLGGVSLGTCLVELRWLCFHRFSFVCHVRHGRLPNPLGAKSTSQLQVNARCAVQHRLDGAPNLAHYAPMSVALKMKRSLATAIRERMAAENLNITTFARKTKTGRNSIRRILNSNNTSITLNSIGKAAEALDLDFTLSAKVLTPDQLGELADRLDSADVRKKATLEEEFVAGFYGKPLKRANAKNTKV